MHRPTRQHQNLVTKVAEKNARSHKKKPGRKAKKWSKWIAQYAPLVAQPEQSGGTPAPG